MLLNPQPFYDAGFRLEEDIPLNQLGSFQLGGPLRYLLTVSRPDELAAARRLCAAQGLRPLLIGEGSNLLFADAGWPGLLIRYVSELTPPLDLGDGLFRCNAAVNLHQLASWAAAQGRAGLEAFSGIPGTLGGAVAGNAGAWGVQMAHVLHQVRVIDTAGEVQVWSVADCGFAYRDSGFKHGDAWVAEAEIRLTDGDPAVLRAEQQRILDLRAARHPDWRQQPCIGSFFKNLEPSSAAARRQAAGYFLEAAGAKTRTRGGAGVYAGHANILVKQRPDCKAEDVAGLARELQTAVQERFGIALAREVRYLGAIPGERSADGFY